jgi:hypothetical protein
MSAMPATVFKYIKALFPIRLFNGALWMEEEDITRLPQSKFDLPEIQDAINQGKLIEVNPNDLPVDVVSPTFKIKGGWDASDGQLPAGRRVGDTFKILPPGGVVSLIPLRPGQRVLFTSLSTFEVLGEGAFDEAEFLRNLTLSDIADVDITDLGDNRVLYYNAAAQKFQFKDITTSLSELTDVDNTNLANGTVPVFNSTSGKFEFQLPSNNLVDLLDVDNTNLANGTVPVFNGTSNKFEFQLPSNNLVDLLDVDNSGLANSVVPIYSSATSKFELKPINASDGFVAITDIVPQSINDNVYDKVLTDDNYVLQSCKSSTTAVRVYAIAITGKVSFKPLVTINGYSTTVSRIGSTDTWLCYADIVVSGSSPYTITALHAEGGSDTASMEVVAAPVVISIFLTDTYPSSSSGQVEHAAGQTVTLNVQSDQDFNAIEISSDTSNALVAGVYSVSLGASASIVVPVADRGVSTVTKSVTLRVKNANGTWSSYVTSTSFGLDDGTHTLQLNNARPSISFGAVSYPVGQSALKDVETATVPVTYLNVDEVVFSSITAPVQLDIVNPTMIEPTKTVARRSGSVGYNISVDNLQAVVTKTSNATTSTAARVVNIAHDPATITSISKPSRLRSSATGVNHTITVNCNQRTQSLSMAAEVGDLQGASWTTLDQGETYTRQLRIDDADSKQLADFNSVSLVNLAGVVTTELTINPLILQYTVGGFVQRTVFVNAWTDGSTPSQREASIGTEVGDISKLVVTIGSSAGAFTNTLTTYTSPSNPATTNYAVTGPSGVLNSTTGNLIFVRDTLLASGNVTGTLPVIVEETT